MMKNSNQGGEIESENIGLSCQGEERETTGERESSQDREIERERARVLD